MTSISMNYFFCHVAGPGSSLHDWDMYIFFLVFIKALVVGLDIYWLSKLYKILNQWTQGDLFVSPNNSAIILPILLLFGGTIALVHTYTVDGFILTILFSGFASIQLITRRMVLITFMPHHLKMEKDVMLYSEIAYIQMDKSQIRFYENEDYYELFKQEEFTKLDWHNLQEKTQEFAQKNNILLKTKHE